MMDLLYHGHNHSKPQSPIICARTDFPDTQSFTCRNITTLKP